MKSKYVTILIFLVLSILIFYGSWKDNIIFTDEILFEEAAYQMVKTGDFLAPRQQDEIWLEKPPLYFWTTALIYQFTKPSPLARRLPVLVTAIATLFLTYKLARYFYKQEVAQWAIILLATTPLFLYFTKTAILDIPATFFITAAIYTYLLAKNNTPWIFLSGLLLGLGILTRSFLALTPILIIAIDQLLISKQKIPVKFLALALTLALAISLPWHFYAFNKYPERFTADYLGFNITSHLLKPTPGHLNLSLKEFLVAIFLKFNPLALLSIAILFTKRKMKNSEKILPLWIASSLLPLSLSATRHEWYAIQALPPIAILASLGLLQMKKRIKAKLDPIRWEFVRVLALSLLLSLPIAVFLSIPQETPVITMLNAFIERTPNNTPLYNLEFQFTPQSSLFNPRETPILETHQLQNIDQPIYLYLDNQAQFNFAQDELQKCCTHEIFLSQLESKIIFINPK